MNYISSLVIILLKINFVIVVPWIALTVPAAAIYQQQLLIILVLVPLGLSGTLTGSRSASSLTSVVLIGLIIWSKVGSDLFHLGTLDSALLLLEFMTVIFLMEATNTAISVDQRLKQLRGRNDDFSLETRRHLLGWAREHILGLAKITSLSFALSLGLLVVGDLLSVSFSQIAISGVLVLVAVAALVVLLIYGREPEQSRRRHQVHSSHIS